MNAVKSKLFIGAVCFILGIGAVLLGQRYFQMPKGPPHETSSLRAMQNMDSMLDGFYDDDFFGRARDPFEQMRRMRRQMMKQFEQPEEGGGVFDSWYRHRFGGGDAGEIKKREDKNFVYYDIAIKDLDQEKLDVKVADGQINISGQIEEKSKGEGGGGYFSTSFRRSFPVPPDVDSNKVQMDHTKDLLTLRFPKVDAHG